MVRDRGVVIGGIPEFRWDEELHACGFGCFGKGELKIHGTQADGGDDDVDIGESGAEGGEGAIVNFLDGGTLGSEAG